jgi:hypothetical protein
LLSRMEKLVSVPSVPKSSPSFAPFAKGGYSMLSPPYRLDLSRGPNPHHGCRPPLGKLLL